MQQKIGMQVGRHVWSENAIIGLLQKSAYPHSKGIGIGDDCAVVPIDASEVVTLVSTDLLIEGTHFLREGITPAQLGAKALAVNLSDIAAMGGKPTSVFLSLAIPRSLPNEWVSEFVLGWSALANRFQVSLLGGDTCYSKDLIVVNVTIMGEMKRAHVKLRSTAKPGDLIAVTGPLGDSKAGLEILLKQVQLKSHLQWQASELVRRHLEPNPKIAAGQVLSRFSSVHAMMDISDGLLKDSERLMTSSNCRGVIDLEKLPLSPELRSVSLNQNWNAADFALAGGEDYELLFTVEPAGWEEVQLSLIRETGVPAIVVGQVSAQAENESAEVVRAETESEKYEGTLSQVQEPKSKNPSSTEVRTKEAAKEAGKKLKADLDSKQDAESNAARDPVTVNAAAEAIAIAEAKADNRPASPNPNPNMQNHENSEPRMQINENGKAIAPRIKSFEHF